MLALLERLWKNTGAYKALLDRLDIHDIALGQIVGQKPSNAVLVALEKRLARLERQELKRREKALRLRRQARRQRAWMRRLEGEPLSEQERRDFESGMA